MRSFHPATHLLATVTLVVLSALMVSAASGQEKPNPIVAKVKASVQDPTKPFTMLVHLHVKEGTSAKVEAAFARAVKLTRREKGCSAYDLNRDAKMPSHYLIYERWHSVADLEAHLQSGYITTLLMELGELLAAPPEVQVFLPVGN